MSSLAAGLADLDPIIHAPKRLAVMAILDASTSTDFGVLLWLAASYGFSEYISQVADVGAIYGTFTAAILLVAWLWLTHVALLLGAELNVEVERERELAAGVAMEQTLNLPTRRGRW